MSKIIAILISTAIIFSNTSIVQAVELQASSSLELNKITGEFIGNGSKSNPYIITDAAEFDNIRNNNSAHYKLTADINMSTIKEFTPIENFYGVIDGNNHTVSGITINKPSEDLVSIFKYNTKWASIKNINFTNVNISGKSIVGGLVAVNEGAIENVSIDGTVISTGKEVGGIAGENTGSVMNSISSVNVTGDDIIGGIVGTNPYGVISGVAFDDTLTTKTGNILGGIAGTNTLPKSLIERSYWNATKSGVIVGVGQGLGDGVSVEAHKKGMVGIKLPLELPLKIGEVKTQKIELLGDPKVIDFKKVKTTSDNESISTITIENDSIILKAITQGDTNINITFPLKTKNFTVKSKVSVTTSYKKEDINNDNIIDIADLSKISLHYNKTSTDAGYDTKFDLNDDGVIDIHDITIVYNTL